MVVSHPVLKLNLRTGISLLGVKDGSNRTFTTPEVFFHNVGKTTIEVFHNGRQLIQTQTSSPNDGDFRVEEGGGPGTGYNTVVMLALIPVSRSQLTANYVAA